VRVENSLVGGRRKNRSSQPFGNLSISPGLSLLLPTGNPVRCTRARQSALCLRYRGNLPYGCCKVTQPAGYSANKASGVVFKGFPRKMPGVPR
jgi:hypothetical protein